MHVTIWHRADPDNPADLRRGYQPGDPINQVLAYEIDAQRLDATPGTVREILDQAFRCFNGFPASDTEHDLTRRYRDAGHRSLSVGDVVVIGELAMSCEPYGWTPVALAPTDEA